MKDQDLKTIVCRNCSATLDAGDSFCRRCGMPTSNQTSIAFGWSERPLVILPLLFLVIGPLALPLLWRSRCFTRGWKIGLTVLTSILTLYVFYYVFWSLWVVVKQAIASLSELEKIRR
jgi:hypothetical protein